LFAYGITNAGKTYTISGGDKPETQGLLPRILSTLFRSIHADPSSTSTSSSPLVKKVPDHKYFVWLSYTEIYNETIYDIFFKKIKIILFYYYNMYFSKECSFDSKF